MCALPKNSFFKMTYTVSGGTLNPTHSLTFSESFAIWDTWVIFSCFPT